MSSIAKVIAFVSLSGGMGKTTLTLMTARIMARMGYQVLAVDCDSQANFTRRAGHEVGANDPTLLDVVEMREKLGFGQRVGKPERITAADACYLIEDNLALIPADGALNKAEAYLIGTGSAVTILRSRLKPILNEFDFILLDSPPQRSQMVLSLFCAADALIVAAETSEDKGADSVRETLRLVDSLQAEGHEIEVAGVVPFRDGWTGSRYPPTEKIISYPFEEPVNQIRKKESTAGIAAIVKALEEWEYSVDLMLPSILDSEPGKKALTAKKTPGEMGYPELDYPFKQLIGRLEELRK